MPGVNTKAPHKLYSAKDAASELIWGANRHQERLSENLGRGFIAFSGSRDKVARKTVSTELAEKVCMSISHALWAVGAIPQALAPAKLLSEKILEDMIVVAPQIVSNDWLLIGRQVPTAHGKFIDLLAVAPDGALVVIEIKRERTSRETVAQALDYASWIETLDLEAILDIYRVFAPNQDLGKDFAARFGQPLAEDELNHAHQVVIVAASLDPASERIVGYLADRGIDINVLSFQVFDHNGQQFLSRAWLLDPVVTLPVEGKNSRTESAEPWNGEYYSSFGDGPERSWSDAVKYGFISAGGGAWYSRTLNLLKQGDLVWVKVPGRGFVGVGRVVGPSESAATFQVKDENGKPSPVLEVAHGGHYHAQFADDPEKCEYFVPIEWLETVSLDHAINEFGLFGNQNSVCRPTTPKWRSTVETLKLRFPKST